MAARKSSKKVLLVLGTRPEAVKLAMVTRGLMASSWCTPYVCVTAQHRQLLDPILNFFAIRPDCDLDIMSEGQSLTDISCRVLQGLDTVLARETPDWVVVQGDTTTTFAAALAAFYHNIPVAHVEAGLRTHNLRSPWPEELNRCLTGTLTSLHLAPTSRARDHLIQEGVPEANIRVTGNPIIDALHNIAGQFPFLAPRRKLILVTGHRRENFGKPFEVFCNALRTISQRPDVQVVYPVHRNPNVHEPAHRLLGNLPHLHLIAPQDYLPFVYLMSRSHLIITDSGGIQEEAPALGKPVLVTRQTTERPEAIEAGTARLVGTDADCIVDATNQLLDDPETYERMARVVSPFGDGHAAKRIVHELEVAQAYA
jgi:UDP-N-acetylglucosamine 2-epimerase